MLMLCYDTVWHTVMRELDTVSPTLWVLFCEFAEGASLMAVGILT